MSALQWALLVFAIAAVAGIYWYSRPRDRRDRDDERGAGNSDQMDLWGSGAGGAGFDEYGVSEPRVRGSARRAPDADTVAAPDSDGREPSAADNTAPAAAPAEATPAADEKIVAVYVAEREGTYILGPQLHAALRSQGLEFGERSIYHRMRDGRPMFSVASLLKPGELDPAEAAGFSTPGVTLFALLPNGFEPVQVVDDLLRTARALATELHAQPLTSDRKPLTDARVAAMRTDTQQWAETQTTGA